MPLLKKTSIPVKEMEEAIEQDHGEKIPIDTSLVVSTGCTLLDLSISGGRVRGGGMPGGIMVEVFGSSGSGKTAIMVETGASVQHNGGEVHIADTEARLDQEYSKIYGLVLEKKNYYRPNTVGDVKNKQGKLVEIGLEGLLIDWAPENPNVINMFGADSIAALSTGMEMDEGDKRG